MSFAKNYTTRYIQNIYFALQIGYKKGSLFELKGRFSRHVNYQSLTSKSQCHHISLISDKGFNII